MTGYNFSTGANPSYTKAERAMFKIAWESVVKPLRKYDLSGIKIGCVDKEYQARCEEEEARKKDLGIM